MANWTGLAGAAGLAAALEEIQGRRVKEGELQRKLTEGQGEWTPATGGMGGPLGFFDALFGYNRPGQIGFGGQKYQFQPYPTMTEQDAQRLQLTTPETTTTPAYEKPLPPNVQGPLELVPEQETTREVPLPGFVGRQKMTPEFLKTITLEQLRERREVAKQAREQAFWKQLQPGGGGAGTGADDLTEGTFKLDTGGATGATGTTGTTATTGTIAAQPAGGPVPGIDKLSPQFRGKAQLVANRLGINLDDFYRVMHFETGGEFSPATKNRAGSGATGLIQFTEDTAKGLGTTTEALAKMTPEQQLDYVEKHLAPHKGKMGNLKDLFMAVLYPAAVGKPENTVLFTPDKTPKAYLQNAGLDRDKKGYVTVGDAVAAVQRTTGVEPPTATAQAPATATAQAPAVAPAPAATDPATHTYVTRFTQGSEADALKAIAAAEDKANPKNPTDQATLVAMKRALETVFPRGQAQAQAQTQPDTSMMVAGDAAPAPKTTGTVAPQVTTAQPTTTAQVQPTTQETFQLTPETRSTIESNNRQIIGINAKLRDLRTRREQILSSQAAGSPRGLAYAQQFTAQITELEKDKNTLRDKSQTLRDKEFEEHRQRVTKGGDIQRKPAELAAEKTAVQDAEMTEPLRFTKIDLVAKGLAPDKPWKDYSNDEKSIVTREHGSREKESNLIEKLDPWERSALFQITKDEGTPQGRATDVQLRRARLEGRKNEAAFEQQKKIALGEATLDTVMPETDALRWINPQTRQPATNMTPRQAKDAGYMLMAKPQQDTLKNGYNSIQYISRLNTLYFGGIDQDGSITGQAGTKFEGIYPWVEKTRKETQTLGARASQTAAVRTGLLQGKTMAQWARVADNFIDASLGAISRDLGGERGHFTDIDAQRARKFFTNFGSGWWGKTLGDPNLMRTSGEAKDMMGLVTGVITDRVRGALDLAPGDPLPWNIQGTLLPRPAPKKGPSTPTTGQTQESVPATGTPAAAQEPAPTSQPTQEPAPAPTTGAAPKKLDGPTAQQHMQQALGELFPGRAVQSLSVDEKRQMLERMRAIGSAAGFTP